MRKTSLFFLGCIFPNLYLIHMEKDEKEKKKYHQIPTDAFTPNDLYPKESHYFPEKTIIVFQLKSHELVINK